MVKSFSLIESNLTWDVGNGEKVQVGRDPWLGSEQMHVFPEEVINTLALRGITTLNQLADERPEDPWTQHWKSADLLGLGEHEMPFYENYIRGLQLAHIQLTEQEDNLIWDLDPGGAYSPKAGYLILSTEDGGREEVWWWRSLWKLKCPAKARLFMWCVLEDRALTWDILQKRSFQGPGWCVLCKKELETIPHLFISCPYMTAVWKDCLSQVGLNHRWEGITVSSAWENRWRSYSYSKFKPLPLIILWGI